MRKWIFLGVMTALSFAGFKLVAQTGQTCSSAVVIASLPYQQSGMTTAGSINDYDNTMACSSNYMTGEDFVFAYTPVTDEVVTITLSNTGQYVGLFITDSCPDVAGASCVAQNGAILGNNTLTNITLIGGHTYYIIVDTQDPILGFIPNASTAFDIDIALVNPYDVACNFFMSPSGSSCDPGVSAVTIGISNEGLVDVDSIEVAYSINGGVPVVETYYPVLIPGGTDMFTFSTPADLSTDNTTYNIQAWTQLANDANPGNDMVQTSVNNLMSVSAFPYEEGFESGTAGWSANGTNSSWALGAPSAPVINSAPEGTNAWVTNLSGNYNTGEASYLVSPCFDFSTLSTPRVTFDLWYVNSGIMDYAVLEYSTDQGSTWSVVGQMDDPGNWYNTADGWSGNSGGWITATHKLNGLGGLGSIQLRLSFTGSFAQTAEGLAFDHIVIDEAPANDVGVVAITAPVTGCGLGSNQITVQVRNYGTAPQSGVPVSYSVNGGTYNNEVLPVTLSPDTTIDYTFAVTSDFSIPGPYTIKAFTGLPADADAANDTTTTQLVNQINIAVYPYNEDFEISDGGWIAGGLNSSFALGVPAAVIIDHAASGSNAWVTNLSGNANMLEASWVMSPCLDFTSLTLPVFEMQLWYETGGLADYAKLEYSLDNGNSWFAVGAQGDDYNWYNNQNGWSGQTGNYVVVKHTLDGLGGAANVKLRVSYNGGSLGAEGVAFDMVRIYDAPDSDLGVTAITAPVTSCGLGNETVSVVIRNYGLEPQAGFDVKYSLDGGSSWVSETVTDSVFYGTDYTYMFTTPADLTAQGTYDFIATTALTGDEDFSNDTAFATVYNNGISSFPYSEDFEATDGFFTASENSSWEWGVPAAPVISSAASGTHAWVTNLTGNYLSNESSTLTFACLDLSTLENPYITFSIWYETTLAGSVTLEGSNDGGSTWFVIGSGSDTDWYDGIIVEGFSGSAAGWSVKQHSLDNMAGAANAMLRFNFSAGTSFLGLNEGVGIDDINIYECSLPEAGFIGSMTGATFNGTNTSTGATSYLWDFGDGSTATTTDAVHTYTSTGTYVISLYAYNDCGENIDSQSFVWSGIAESSSAMKIECYPNPGNGQFMLNINQEHLQDLTVSITDLTGREIYSSLIPATLEYSGKVDLGNIAPGIYNLQLQSPVQVYNVKLVVE